MEDRRWAAEKAQQRRSHWFRAAMRFGRTQICWQSLGTGVRLPGVIIHRF